MHPHPPGLQNFQLCCFWLNNWWSTPRMEWDGHFWQPFLIIHSDSFCIRFVLPALPIWQVDSCFVNTWLILRRFWVDSMLMLQQTKVVLWWNDPILFSDNQHGIQKQLKGLHTIPVNISVRRSVTWSNMAAENMRVSTCQESLRIWWQQCRCSPGSVFCLLPGVTSGCARPITGQVTSVTWPVIGWAQPELTQWKF